MTSATQSQAQSQKVIDWTKMDNPLPWFDQPDAIDQLDKKITKGIVNKNEAEYLEKWIKDGYSLS